LYVPGTVRKLIAKRFHPLIATIAHGQRTSIAL
jgi:hypothetical protein